MRTWIVAGFLAVAGSACAAQATYCGNAGTQIDINFCAKDAWERADRTLNDLWGVLKPRADAQGWGQRLLDEQRAWLRARDAKCEPELQSGGSADPMFYYSCMEEMTLRRNDDFRRMM